VDVFGQRAEEERQRQQTLAERQRAIRPLPPRNNPHPPQRRAEHHDDA
jgi:hypothetical protein